MKNASSTSFASEESAAPPGLTGLQQLVLVAVLTVAIIPLFLFIRAAATEVTRYSALTFEAHAREALEAGKPLAALEICTGAFRSTLGSDAHWGAAHLLTAQAHGALGQSAQALAALEMAADFWTQRYYFATEENRFEAMTWGRQFSGELLERAQPGEARDAYAATARASGDPADFLAQLVRELPAEAQTQLWPDAPAVVLHDFTRDDAFAAVDSPGQPGLIQSRERVSNPDGSGTLAQLILASTGGADAALTAPVYVPLGTAAFRIRAVARTTPETPARWLLNVWIEQAQESVLVTAAADSVSDSGWMTFHLDASEVVRQVEARGYLAEDGFINQIGLLITAEAGTTVFLDRVELLATP